MTEGFASYPEITFEEVAARMESEMPNLPRQEARVAQYMLLNLNMLSVETGKSLAQKAGVAEITVGRLLRRLGCKGMREFKALLRRRYQVAGGVDFTRREVAEGHRASLAAELSAVQAAFAQADSEEYAHAVDLLTDSDEIFVTGFQSVRGLAEDCARRLSLARSCVRYLAAHDGMLAEWLEVEDRRRSCLLLVDVVPYSAESQRLSKLAKAEGKKLVIVSDEYCHWGQDVADVMFHTPSATGLFLESTLGLNALLSLLVNGVANRGGKDYRLRKWKQFARDLDLF